MLRPFLRAKLHHLRVTRTDKDYEGSIAIDQSLIEAAGLSPLEQVEIYNVTTGARFATYIIVAPPGSGAAELNGAAARLAYPGDVLIVAGYCWLQSDEIPRHVAQVVQLNAENRVESISQNHVSGAGA